MLSEWGHWTELECGSRFTVIRWLLLNPLKMWFPASWNMSLIVNYPLCDCMTYFLKHEALRSVTPVTLSHPAKIKQPCTALIIDSKQIPRLTDCLTIPWTVHRANRTEYTSHRDRHMVQCNLTYGYDTNERQTIACMESNVIHSIFGVKYHKTCLVCWHMYLRLHAQHKIYLFRKYKFLFIILFP